MSHVFDVYPNPVPEIPTPTAGSVDLELGRRILGQLIEVNFTNLLLNDTQAGVMEEVEAAAIAFFSQSLEEKLRHQAEKQIKLQKVGYRLHGAAYTTQLDENDSFISREGVMVPNQDHPKAVRLLATMADFREQVAMPAVEVVSAALADRYDYAGSISFRRGSIVQVNSYQYGDERLDRGINNLPFAGPDASNLQGWHEDGTFLTILKGTYHGLRAITRSGVIVPISHGRQAVTIFGGSVLQAATDGDIQECWHEALNYRYPHRIVTTCFASPETKGSDDFIPSYKGSQNIAAVALKATDQFGIPPNFANYDLANKAD